MNMGIKQTMRFQEKVLLFILLILTVIVSGCVSETPEASEDYAKQLDAINKDLKNAELLQAEWDVLINQYNKGSAIDLIELENFGNKYLDNANVLKAKIETFKNFIDKNEVELRSLGVDVVSEKLALDEHKGRLETNTRIIQESMNKIGSASSTAISDQGDFKVMYSPVTNQDYSEYERIFKDAQLFENEAQVLNDALILPYDITINVVECGEENAFYDPSTKQIIMCYELMDHLAEVFYDYSETDTDLGTAMLSSMYFVFYHEVGHMVIDIYDLPSTGNPEDNADQVSTLFLLSSEESGINVLLDGADWFFIKSEESNIEESVFSDIHSPDRRRYYNLLCWIYGSDTRNGEYLITEWELPEDRASGCEDEYIRMFNAWNRLLSPYLK